MHETLQDDFVEKKKILWNKIRYARNFFKLNFCADGKTWAMVVQKYNVIYDLKPFSILYKESKLLLELLLIVLRSFFECNTTSICLYKVTDELAIHKAVQIKLRHAAQYSAS